jgi:apolipoprotein N-acyltransferase
MALGGPGTELWFCVWIGLAIFAFALDDDPERRLSGGLRGLFFGTAVNMVVLRFVPTVITTFTPLSFPVGLLALFLLSLEQSLRFVAVGIVTVRLVRIGMPRWIAFTIGAFAGTLVPVVFPWNAAGGLTPWPVFVQLGDIIGERGVTALVAASAALLAEAAILWRPARKHALVFAGFGLALPGLMAGYGAVRMAHVAEAMRAAPHAKVALVMPDIEAHERWIEGSAAPIAAKLGDLTRDAEKKGAELTVWPEAAFPYRVSTTAKNDMFGPFAILQPGVHGPVLTGAITFDPKTADAYNSALVCCEEGKLSPPYHKMHLLWFGETVPFADVWPWIRKTFARGTGLTPGEHQVILRAGRIRAAVLNCFEDTLPKAGRETFDDQSPNLLVNVTNDAWFYGSDESELHLRLAAMRSVEVRRDLVRAVNRGPTSWVDASGRVRARYDLKMPGVLMTEPALLETSPTLFARAGDWPLGILSIGLVGFWSWKKRRDRGTSSSIPS